MRIGRKLLGSRGLAAAALAVLMSVALFGAALPAGAQTDPYTGGGVGVEVQVRPGLFLSIGVATPGDLIRIEGCFFRVSALVRILLNPGNTQTQGTPCPRRGTTTTALGEPLKLQLIGVGSTASQRVFLQTSTTTLPCAFDNPVTAGPADNTADGGIGTTSADNSGCVDTLVRVPDRPAGTYQLCTVSTGVETVCAVVRLTSSSKVLGRSVSRGFARTGIYLIPLVIAALAAIIVGRRMAKRRHASAPQ